MVAGSEERSSLIAVACRTALPGSVAYRFGRGRGSDHESWSATNRPPPITGSSFGLLNPLRVDPSAGWAEALFNSLWEDEMDNHISPDYLGVLGGKPNMDFFWKEVAGKRRLIGNPNKAMRVLHRLFGDYILKGVKSTDDSGYGIRKLPSATGCVPDSNPLKNAQKHAKGRFFYITDLKNAYPSVDLDRLALVIVYLSRYEDYCTEISTKFFAEDRYLGLLRETPLFGQMFLLLRHYFAGMQGTGLAVGGPLSPYLMNLYCEVYLDSRLRRWCERHDIIYTRYVDDLAFSSAIPIDENQRREIRRFVRESGFEVNRRKSKVLALVQGTVFITKVGLEYQPGKEAARVVFPQGKRRTLHTLIGSYLTEQTDWPEKVSGLIAEFLYHYKNVWPKTETDKKTFALCQAFEREWAKYRKGPAPRRTMKKVPKRRR